MFGEKKVKKGCCQGKAWSEQEKTNNLKKINEKIFGFQGKIWSEQVKINNFFF